MVQKKEEIKTNHTKTNILIVDDHPIVRAGLTELINQEKDLIVCGQAEDAQEAMKAIRKFRPEMAIIDISLKDTSGLELVKDIKIHYPDVLVLILSMHDESLYAERALRAGAKGYIMKHQATEKVITAIHHILNGDLYISDEMSAKMVSKLIGGKSKEGISPIDRLSDRELEVFLLIGQGFGTRHISKRLHLSIKTIETYRTHIKEKLNLSNAAELRQYAIQWRTSQTS
jgi:DNA-binding NarL/FixJ family response regulator